MDNFNRYYFEKIDEAASYSFKVCYDKSHLILTDDNCSKKNLTSKSCAKERFSIVFSEYIKDVFLLEGKTDSMIITIGTSFESGYKKLSPILSYCGYATALFDEELEYDFSNTANRFLLLRRYEFSMVRNEALSDLVNWQKHLSIFRLDGAVEVNQFPLFIQMMLMRNNELAITGRPSIAIEKQYRVIIDYYKKFLPRNHFMETLFNMIDDGELTGKYLDNSGMEAIFNMVTSECQLYGSFASNEELDEYDELIRPLALASAIGFPSTSKIMEKLYGLSMVKSLLGRTDDPDAKNPGDLKPKSMIKKGRVLGNIIYVDFNKEN